MRRVPSSWILLAAFGFASPAFAADKPQLEIKDIGLPLHELRPLDRRVYVLVLDGYWNTPAVSGTPYYINVFYHNGRTSSHRAIDDPGARPGEQSIMVRDRNTGRWQLQQVYSPFRLGEVRVVLQDYELINNQVAQSGMMWVGVSAARPVPNAYAPGVVSNIVPLKWPLDRAIVREAPRTRLTPPDPVDAMPRPK